jgi:hypothetical protein
MFERAGFETTKDYEGVDLVAFLGGTDVSPEIYGEERGPHTQAPDKQRDEIEIKLYKKFLDIPKVGICRGGQLLNVLNGGKMIQHLGKCVSGDVMMFDAVFDRGLVEVRVDHHQGMRVGWDKISSDIAWLDEEMVDSPDYVGFYEKTKSLCFQPHPEWGHKGTEDYFFELIERYFGMARKDTACAA